MAEFNEEENKKQSYEIEGQGKQLNYQDYLTYKEDFNDSRTVSYSSSDLYKKRKAERDKQIFDTLLYGSASVGVGSLLYKQANRSENIRSLIQELPSARLARTKLTKQFLDNKAAGIIFDAMDPRFAGSQTIGQSLHSMLLGLEELSPGQLLKTLQLYSFSELFVEVFENRKNEARHISEASLRTYAEYYRNLIKAESNIDLTDTDFKHGFILEDNKLYSSRQIVDNAGNISYQKDRVLLNHAQAVTSGIATGDTAVSSNRVFEKFANQYKASIRRTQVEAEPFVIIGANKKNDLLKNWTKAFGAFSVELGAKSLDNPLGFLEEYINLSGTGSKVFNSNVWKTAKRFSNLQLGAGGKYDDGVQNMLKRTGKNLATKGAAVAVGYYALEGLIDSIAPEDSVWSNGIAAGVADTLMNVHVKFAEVWSDNFQRLKKAQENAAPGSTSIATLLGLPLAGAMLGANISYFKRIGEGTIKGIDGASVRALDERRIGGLMGDLLDKIGKNAPTTALGRNAKIGTTIGAVLALPFLPGALVGKSSEELKAEYSGEKKIAVRQTRHWLMGGGAFEGGKIQQHRDHILRVLSSDARNKTLYEDAKTKRSLNPIFNPIGYLNDPYRFEKMHTHDMPMPVWGMDVSYGSFMGQMYKGTLGQILKPTRINPAILEDQRTLLTPLGGLSDIPEDKSVTPQSINKASVAKVLYAEGERRLQSIVGERENFSVDSDAYVTPEHEKKEVKSLIEDGLMLRANAPTNEPFTRSFQGAWSASEEFIGIKGFVGGLTLGTTGYNPVEQLRPELEISGSSTNFAKTLTDAQMGDFLGCFIEGTLVYTKRGFTPIEKVTTKDKVLSLGNKYKRVVKTFKKEVKDVKVLRVYVEELSLPIVCTPDHVFPSFSMDTLDKEDKRIMDLKEGDYLYKAYCNSTQRLFFNTKECKTKVVKIKRIEERTYSGIVHDLQVEDTPYYTVEGIFCHNSGEYLRRLFPQSASSKRETINPMRNLVAPNWLPQNETKFYENFSRGSYYSHTPNGEFLLPGSKGFEALNPELKGMDPNDYPLVYQYSVLQNVARNSPEHLAVKEHLIRNIDKMTDKEKDVFYEAYGQDTAREQLKQFSEYATKEERNSMGIFSFHNSIWEFVAHKENPLEPLLPFRPMAKFVHKRTAEEDYIKTQIMGPDTGIWTNPYSHFIKPSANRIANIGVSGFLSDEYLEKNRIDQYFDKLSLIKADRNNDQYEKERNITSLAYLGVRSAEDMRRFKMALDSEQRAYVDSFSREKDLKKRERLLQILPNDVGRVYQSIWKNMDLYDQAIAKGIDPKKMMDAEYLKDTAKLAKVANVSLNRQEKEEIRGKKFSLEATLGINEELKMKEAKALRLKAALRDAEQYVEKQTGSLPGDKWIGWDPRLKMDDIKLKTLMVGREDIHRFGFWQQDVTRIERLVGLTETSPIVNDLEEIKREKKDQTRREVYLRNKLRSAGFETSRITSAPASKGSLTINDTTEYLDNYYSR